MKTPDEIKKGLECAMPRSCNGHKCSTCPNATYSLHELLKGDLIKDTFDYIAQLEQRLAQLERERNALMRDFKLCATRPMNVCYVCKNRKNPIRNMCEPCDAFEWRGVCEENSKEGSK